MNPEELATIANLIRSQRTAALATLADDAPFASFVAYAPEPDFGGMLLHLSRLAAHTRHLLASPRASLLIAESDDRRDDAQTLARITLSGTAQPILAEDPGYAAARACYLGHLPASEMLFSLGDFTLFRLTPSAARYVGGFARAYSLSAQQLRQAAQAVG